MLQQYKLHKDDWYVLSTLNIQMSYRSILVLDVPNTLVEAPGILIEIIRFCILSTSLLGLFAYKKNIIDNSGQLYPPTVKKFIYPQCFDIRFVACVFYHKEMVVFNRIK